jgi:hypothetical protein
MQPLRPRSRSAPCNAGGGSCHRQARPCTPSD